MTATSELRVSTAKLTWALYTAVESCKVLRSLSNRNAAAFAHSIEDLKRHSGTNDHHGQTALSTERLRQVLTLALSVLNDFELSGKQSDWSELRSALLGIFEDSSLDEQPELRELVAELRHPNLLSRARATVELLTDLRKSGAESPGDHADIAIALVALAKLLKRNGAFMLYDRAMTEAKAAAAYSAELAYQTSNLSIEAQARVSAAHSSIMFEAIERENELANQQNK